jgi:hypothetical protein
LVSSKEASVRILLTCIALAWAATMFLLSHAEKQQEAALERLSSYKLERQLVDDADLNLVTARSPYMRDER